MAISFSFLFLRRVRISNCAANFAGNQGQALREWKLLKVTKGAGAVKPAIGQPLAKGFTVRKSGEFRDPPSVAKSHNAHTLKPVFIANESIEMHELLPVYDFVPSRNITTQRSHRKCGCTGGV
jgi:hypothetical protein